MRIEKLKCDGCGAEYELTTDKLTIRIVNSDTEKGISKTRLNAEAVSVSIDRNTSLDFCNINCFQLYIANLKKIEVI